MNDLHLIKDIIYFLAGINAGLIIFLFLMILKISDLQSRVDAHEKMFCFHNKAGMETIKMLTLLKDAIFETEKAVDKSDVKQG